MIGLFNGGKNYPTCSFPPRIDKIFWSRGFLIRVYTDPDNPNQAKMSFQPTPADASVIISTASTQSTSNGPSLATERRITPSWSITQLKGKLETMTGVPPGSQRLLFKSPGRPDQWIEGEDRLIGEWGLVRGCEIEVCCLEQTLNYHGQERAKTWQVHDTRPPAARPNFEDLSSVEKYELPAEKYESLSNSVLAWKKSQKLGRFDPNAQSPEQILYEQVAKDVDAIEKRSVSTLT